MMTDVSQTREIERVERKLVAAMGARDRDCVAAIEALEEAIAFARSSSEAAAWFGTAELLADLSDEYAAAGRPDDALAAMHRAIDEGWMSAGDPRCRLAEIQLGAGRTAEAEAIWVQLRREHPDDLWLFNNAGVAYCSVRDWSAGLRWLTDGLELALRPATPTSWSNSCGSAGRRAWTDWAAGPMTCRSRRRSSCRPARRGSPGCPRTRTRRLGRSRPPGGVADRLDPAGPAGVRTAGRREPVAAATAAKRSGRNPGRRCGPRMVVLVVTHARDDRAHAAECHDHRQDDQQQRPTTFAAGRDGRLRLVRRWLLTVRGWQRWLLTV
jgi:hypothetical protein